MTKELCVKYSLLYGYFIAKLYAISWDLLHLSVIYHSTIRWETNLSVRTDFMY